MPQTAPRQEMESTYARYLSVRRRAEVGEVGWDSLADFFTSDAVFIDPAWGRIEGNEAIRSFLRESMCALEGWTFPHEWTVVDGARVVSKWQNRLPGQRPDGTFYEVPGITVLDYAGNGLFWREEDFMNMAHFYEILRDSKWMPTKPMSAPPKHPRR